MKRLICMLLPILFLCGCGIMGERIKDPVTFYYVREDYQKDMEPVIASEVREASGHRYDLPYLLALYSMGPSQEDLRSPLPEGVRIIPTEHTEDGIVVSLSEIPESMTDADYTLAGVCLAMTCMELIDAPQITIISGDRSITISTDNILTSETGYQSQVEEKQ